jgi:hypothetical protein
MGAPALLAAVPALVPFLPLIKSTSVSLLGSTESLVAGPALKFSEMKHRRHLHRIGHEVLAGH